MKKLVCEMCGNSDLIKQDGLFVCQFCGAKYSLEEAKKLMIEGVVEVKGTIKVDNSDELSNLYQIARRAKADNNSENAEKYYNLIITKDPSSWEANFYTVYYQSMNCTIAGIRNAAIRLNNCEDTVLQLIKENVTDTEERRSAVDEIGAKLIKISNILFDAAKNHYDEIGYEIKANYIQEFLDNCCAARDILYNYGDYLIKFFNDEYGKDIAVPCWKKGIDQHKILMPFFKQKETNKNIIESYGNKIKIYDPSYQIPIVNTSNGCYVATCVYGSYNCPQVWTLRRYRDNILGATWHGRLFIKLYYAISPTLVKWFGHTKWFKKTWKAVLDKKVKRLQDNGIEDTPYNDIDWRKINS